MEYHLIQQYKGITRTDDMNDATLFGLVSVELNDVKETVEKPYTPPLPPSATVQEIKPVTTVTRNGVTLKMYDSRLIPSDVYTTGTVYGYLLPRADHHNSSRKLQIIGYDYIRSTTDLDVVKDVVAVSGINPDAPTLVPNIMQLWKLSSSAAPTFGRNLAELSDLLTSVHSLHGNCYAMVGGLVSINEYLVLNSQSSLGMVPKGMGHKVAWMLGGNPELGIEKWVQGRRQSPSTLGRSGGKILVKGNKQGMSFGRSIEVLKQAEIRDVEQWVKNPILSDDVLRINKLSVAFNTSWYEMYNTVTAADKFHIYLLTSAASPSGLFVRK